MSRPWYATELLAQRKEQGLTTGELARRIHYSKSIVEHWENGTIPPSVDALTAWADALGYSLRLHRPPVYRKPLRPSTERLFQELIGALAQLFDEDAEAAPEQEAA